MSRIGQIWVRKNIPPDSKSQRPSAVLRVCVDDDGDRHVSIFTNGSFVLWSLKDRVRHKNIEWFCWEEVK